MERPITPTLDKVKDLQRSGHLEQMTYAFEWLVGRARVVSKRGMVPLPEDDDALTKQLVAEFFQFDLADLEKDKEAVLKYNSWLKEEAAKGVAFIRRDLWRIDEIKKAR